MTWRKSRMVHRQARQASPSTNSESRWDAQRALIASHPAVYHGGPAGIEEFKALQKSDFGYLGKGIYFGSLKIAENYARGNGGIVYKRYLYVENPFLMREKWNTEWPEIVAVADHEVPNFQERNKWAEVISREVQKRGYDSIVDIDNHGTMEVVVYDNKSLHVQSGLMS